MNNPIVPVQALTLGIFADIVAGILAGAELTLFQNNVVPTPVIPIGDYTAPTYAGYADEAITWLAPSVADDGEPEIVGIVGEFRPTNGVTPNQIYGSLLIDSTGVLLAACRFVEGPFPMLSALDSIVLTVRIRLSPLGGFLVDVS